jgi:hypothetical protein
MMDFVNLAAIQLNLSLEIKLTTFINVLDKMDYLI